MAKSNGIIGRFYYLTMFLFLASIGLGAAFIVMSVSARFFKWEVSNCAVAGQATGPSGIILEYFLDMEADIGWREFTVTYTDEGAQQFGCFGNIEEGQTYPLSDYQNNSASAAGLGMVASWGAAMVVALFTLITMFGASTGSNKRGVSLVTLTKWCALFSIGLVVATTVFWWLVEGKFGNREEALAPRLFQLILDAADTCSTGTNNANPCKIASWEMITPGWALLMGITAMFAYPTATLMLWWVAERVDALSNDEEQLEMDMEPTKAVVGGDFVADKGALPEEKARAKDRRSAKTGVRSGARAPSSTVQGDVDAGPDPMTYALQQGGDEMESQEEDEEEVVYQNHQVHHSVVNHSTPNRTQVVDEQASRHQQQYNRGYSRGNSNASYTGGQSFDERSEADFSETASSAQYYAQNQGQSFTSASSRGESFDDYHR